MRKKLSLLSLIFVLAFACAAPASALKSAVYFEGGAEGFVFYPGSEWEDTDLFDGFKDAIPGETYTEEIRVRNSAPEYDYVRLYFRSDPHSETDNQLSESVKNKGETVASMTDFLSQLQMKIYIDGELLGSSSADKIDLAFGNVYLGEFKDGDSKIITMELTVPLELGNEYMHRTGEIDWVFTAECFKNGEVVDPTPTPKPPKTLDDITNYLFIGIASIVALIILIALIFIGRDKKEK